MRFFLVSLLLGTSILFSNCKKSEVVTNNRTTLNAMQGNWTLTTRRCYENPISYILFPAGLTYKFNSDMSGTITWNPGGGSVTPFIYNLLSDDSTLIIQYNGGIPDTTVITSITPNKLVYHGKNTYSHVTSICINSNTTDSLYR